MAMQQQQQFQSGWYADPQNPRNERYFDGRQWTQHVRTDVPDIPLAPWRDPSAPGAANGHAIDTTPPRTDSRLWLMLAAAAVGVGAAFTIGVTQTASALQAGAPVTEPLYVDPPVAGSGPSILPVFTCNDVVVSAYDFLAEDMDLSGQFKDLTSVVDNQPITDLPETAGQEYRVIECDATFATNTGGEVDLRMTVAVDSVGNLTLYYV